MVMDQLENPIGDLILQHRDLQHQERVAMWLCRLRPLVSAVAVEAAKHARPVSCFCAFVRKGWTAPVVISRETARHVTELNGHELSTKTLGLLSATLSGADSAIKLIWLCDDETIEVVNIEAAGKTDAELPREE